MLGGRIVGEACHFVDLLRFLAGCPIVSYELREMASLTRDTTTIVLNFSDGSMGTIHYLEQWSFLVSANDWRYLLPVGYYS